MMKVSPITLAVAMAAGVYITAATGIFTTSISIMIMLVLFLIYIIATRNFNTAILVLIFSFTLSAFSYLYSVSAYCHDTINYTSRYVTLKGTVISTAQKSLSSDNYRYVFRIKSITTNSGTENAHDDILLTTPKKLRCGESLEVKGIIKDLPKQMNENGFDSAAYYKSNNIFTRIYSDKVQKIRRIHVLSVYFLGQYTAERIDSFIFKYTDGDKAAILSAILTGNKHQFSKEYNNVLINTAFKRVLHPAHLHIWIILSVIGLFSKFIRRQYRDIFAAVVFILYVILQCSNIGFARCMFVAAVTIYYRLRYGYSFTPDTLSSVIAFCAAAMPTLLLNSAFILSITGGFLAWAFMPYFRSRLKFIPKKLRSTSAAMLVFAIFLTPIAAYYYSGLCIYSFFTPFVTVPLVVCVLILAPITLLLYSVFGAAPFLSACLNTAVNILYKLPYFIEGLPFSDINIGKPSLTFVLMFICLIFGTYYVIKSRKENMRISLAAACGFCAVLVISFITELGTAKFIHVNVGQGDGAIIHVPFRETVVIDAGGISEYSEYNTGEAQFVPYLESEGINHIEAIIVSHYHKDHAEGIISVLSFIKTDCVFMPHITDADSVSMRDLAKRIKLAAAKNGAEIKYVSDNTQLKFDSGLTLSIYSLSERLRKFDENDTSLCVKAEYGEFRALYTGDMSGYAEKDLIKRADVDIDILKAAHHGSRNSTCPEFLNATSPQACVISCGEDNSYGHPHTEVLTALSGIDVLRTDLMGDIRITARKNGNYRVE